MINLIISIIINALAVVTVVFWIAFLATWALNPTATSKEIFNHWKKVWKGEYNS